jgi:hypothetical protein
VLYLIIKHIKKLRNCFLDEGLLKAMKDVQNDEEIEYEHARDLIKRL